jgi:hypothetical protein
MDLENWGQPVRGLREYFRLVAEACGSGEAFAVRSERPLAGYIPLPEQDEFELDIALVWEERTGWRSVLEMVADNQLVTLSYLDGSVCPAPAEVAEFAAEPRAGAAAPATRTEEDVLDLLSEYAVPGLRPLAR